MAIKLQRPILVSGLGLTLSIWLLESLHPAVMDWGGAAVWGAIALGSGIWWLKQRGQAIDLSSPPPVDRTAVEKALAAVEELIGQLAIELAAPTEFEDATSVKGLRERLAQLTAELDRTDIRLTVIGGKAVGKTTLTQILAKNWLSPSRSPSQTLSVSTPLQSSAEPNAIGTGEAAVPVAADLVLFVTTGDLTSPEFQTLQQLLTQRQRVVLVFNKQDQYLPTERPLILQQLRERMREQLAVQDVVAIAAAPTSIKVRQYQSNGSACEHLEQPTPEIAPLTERLSQILTQEGQQLILATAMRQSLALKTEVLAELNQVRRDRALPVIEQYQWIAAATAFANPVPTLDLLATAAINTQLILDLGAIYQQKFSLQQAKAVAGTLAELMVKLGLVELSTQAIAPLLKSNALTFVAGGLLQGVSAGYLTRLAGLSLVEYFQEQSQAVGTKSPFQIDRLRQKLQAVFQQNQQVAFLQTLVKQSLNRLGQPSQPSLPSATTAPLQLTRSELERVSENRTEIVPASP